jgi:hypothetical protein
MKKIILISIGVLTLNLLTNNAMAQSSNTHYNSDTLCIVWTSGDPDVAMKMVFMYANTAKKNRWFDEVHLIVWGPSAKLASENKEIQETLVKMVENGVKIEACKACADQYGVSQNLKSLGIEVKYMGKPLTEILKSNKKLMTF